MVLKHNQKSKKSHLDKWGKRTKWAPFWAVIKKAGTGKKMHPSAITHVKRNWRHRKLTITPRSVRKDCLG